MLLPGVNICTIRNIQWDNWEKFGDSGIRGGGLGEYAGGGALDRLGG